ncbi:AAA-ATPase-like domain-containing protein [Mycena indigotica]|uniref:AAA-ATPase-like domain-containing protein n=1 Tax=Mycena indigotica TaxID=2126181 RepID=A0A8H6T7V7_9AGAR|nr:AAA-ATPase-like domain-containing protein [Mycena indigotica]KAF7312546.1 AAA-ATPase-like domain-containing protein [Mycena indigotica]
MLATNQLKVVTVVQAATSDSDGHDSSDGSDSGSLSQDAPTTESWSSLESKEIMKPSLLTHIYGPIYARGATIQRLPHPQEEFDAIVNAIGVPLVFKLHTLTQIARLIDCRHALLLRRPPGWGLDLFASMVSAAFDRDYNPPDDPFQILLEQESLTSRPWDRRLHGFFVLDLDFRRLPGKDDFQTELHAYLEKECRELISHYGLNKVIGLPSVKKGKPEEFISLLAFAFKSVSRNPLLVIIRSFDEPTIYYPDGHEVLNPFLNRLEYQLKDHVLGSLLLLSTWDDGSVYSCIGRPPLSLIRRRKPGLQPLDLPCTLDLTHTPAFQTAVGITRAEADALDNAFSHREPRERTRMIHMLDGYSNPSIFADIFPQTHQCPPDSLEGGDCWEGEVNPLAELDRSQEYEGTYAAQLVMKVFALKYGLPSEHGSLGF